MDFPVVCMDDLGICLDEADEAARAIRVGDRLRLADGSERTVESIDGQSVWLAGAKLSAADVGYPHSVRRVTSSMQGVWVTSSESKRCQFEPIVDRSHGTYLLVKARAGGTDSRLVVDYGQGEENLGRFVFNTVADGEPHEYAVRLSVQYNWYHRSNDWLSFESSSGPIEILSATLAEGD